jgi:hypothetical protein
MSSLRQKNIYLIISMPTLILAWRDILSKYPSSSWFLFLFITIPSENGSIGLLIELIRPGWKLIRERVGGWEERKGG